MILDFNYPVLTADGWQVRVIKTDKKGKMYIKPYKSQDKDAIFEIYDMVQAIYRKQQEKQR